MMIIKRKKDLIKKFGSVVNMETASLEELATIVPYEVAKSLQNYLTSRKEK